MAGPSLDALPGALRSAAERVARTLAGAGHRGWLVGGAVRDLARGEPVRDVDMASAATPDEVQALFAHTASVGRAFGTVVVTDGEVPVQLTTFRSESGYADGRRPDRVTFGASVEEDSRRRDFTVNALFLDPLDGTLADPTGGLDDLAARVLRCVGDPGERFREDGLRLLRLARFAASCELEVEAETRTAAAGSLDALRGVSAERVHDELARLASGPNAAGGFTLLAELGVLGRVLPATAAGRVEALSRLPERPGLLRVLAVLLDAGDGSTGHVDAVGELRPPRSLVQGLRAIARNRARLASEGGGRAAALRMVRDEDWPATRDVVRALGTDVERVEELAARFEGLPRGELFPAALLGAADLVAAGVAQGPDLGLLLGELETLQLEGELATRADALAWLDRRISSGGTPSAGRS